MFTGAKDRHVNGYYQELLAREVDHVSSCDGSVENNLVTEKPRAVEKWTAQIEKVNEMENSNFSLAFFFKCF